MDAMNVPLRKLLLLGVATELVLWLAAYALHPSMEETFRYAARYSGRLSAFVFLICFYLFASKYPSAFKQGSPLRNWLTLFAALHVIHFGFLATNVYLNTIPLEAPKLAGGAVAYAMIVAAPFALEKLKPKVQSIYFYYVTLVMTLTYVARIKGDFQGADPFWFHYVMAGTFIASALLFGGQMIRKSRYAPSF